MNVIQTNELPHTFVSSTTPLPSTPLTTASRGWKEDCGGGDRADTGKRMRGIQWLGHVGRGSHALDFFSRQVIPAYNLIPRGFLQIIFQDNSSRTFIVISLFYFRSGVEKYLVGIIVLGILLVISFAITAHYVYQNRQRANVESKNKERNNSKDDYKISATHDGNNEEMENEQSTYTALKRPGERDDDDHVYTHLINAQKVYVSQEESRF